MSYCGQSTLINVIHALYPASDFPVATNFKIPSDLQSGSYYVYVYTNPTKTVFEYPGTPQIKRSTLPITIERPDITVPVITVPSDQQVASPLLSVTMY